MAEKKDGPKTYYLRMAQASDLDAILEFYSTYKHENIKDRDEDVLKERAEHGSIVLLEDEDGEIVAASISFAQVIEENGIETVKWTEIGSTRITHINGYPGVFDLMTTAQVLRSYLVEPPEECFIARMRHDAIQAIADRMGWREFEDASEVENTIAKGREGDWYRFGVEGLPIMAKYMVEAWDKPVLTNKKTGEEIKISFDRSEIFKKFKENIEKLAERDYGSVDKPDLTKGIRQHRDEWLQRRFR